MTDETKPLESETNETSPAADQFQKMQATLEEILHQLKQANRLTYHRDFSYNKLIGAVAQLLVAGLILWTMIGLVDMMEVGSATSTMLKILGATLLQIIAFTFFYLARYEK
jgi:hypothetical protein